VFVGIEKLQFLVAVQTLAVPLATTKAKVLTHIHTDNAQIYNFGYTYNTKKQAYRCAEAGLLKIFGYSGL
jgi:hypothetical protein